MMTTPIEEKKSVAPQKDIEGWEKEFDRLCEAFLAQYNLRDALWRNMLTPELSLDNRSLKSFVSSLLKQERERVEHEERSRILARLESMEQNKYSDDKQWNDGFTKGIGGAKFIVKYPDDQATAAPSQTKE